MANDNNNNNLPTIADFEKVAQALVKSNEKVVKTSLDEMKKVVKASEERAREIKDRKEIEAAYDKVIKSIADAEEAAYAEKAAREDNSKDVAEALGDMGGYLKGLFGFASDEARESRRSISKVEKKAKRKEDASKAGKELVDGLKGFGPIKAVLDFFTDIKKILVPIVALIAGASLTTVGLVIGGIVAAFAAITGAWKRLKPLLGDENATFFDKAVAVMVGAIEGIFQIPAKIMDFGKKLLSGAMKFLFGEDNKVSKFLDSFSFSELVTKAADWAQKTLTTMGKKIGEAFGKIIDWAKEFLKWETIKKGFNDILNDPDGVIGGIGKRLGSAVYGVVDWVLEKFSKAYTWITDTFGETWTKTKQLFTDIGTKIGSVAYDAVQWVKDKLASTYAWVTDVISESWEKTKQLFTDIGTKIGSVVYDAVDWVKEKFSNAYTWVTDKISEGWTKVTDTFDAIGEKIGSVAYDAVEWVKNKVIETKDNLFATIESFFQDPLGTMIDIITAPIDLLIDGVAWVVGKLGFDDLSESLKNFSYADAVKNVIMAPINLLKKGVSWVMNKLGFGEDGEGDGDISDVENEDGNLTKTILDFITAPVRLIGKAFSHVLSMLGFENLLDEIPSPIAMLKEAGEWIGGLLSKAIDWFKSKLSFFGGGDKEMGLDEELEALESSAMARSSVRGEFSDQGAIKTSMTGNVKSFDADKVAQMDSADLKRLKAASKGSNKELDKLIDDLLAQEEQTGLEAGFEATQDFSAYNDHTGFEKFSDEALAEVGATKFLDNEQAQIDAERERRKRQSQKESMTGSGTLEAAMRAEADPRFYDIGYAPTRYDRAVISGTDPQAVAQSDELRASQAVYDANKGPVRQGGDVNTSVNAPTTNNQTINNSYLQSGQPSTRDDTDQMYIFRATGTSR